MSKYESIYDWLPVGKKNGVKIDDIMREFGFTNKRSVQSAIQNERLNGKPICSYSNGTYCKSYDSMERAECLQTIFARSVAGIKSARAMIKAFELEGQMDFSEMITNMMLSESEE